MEHAAEERQELKRWARRTPNGLKLSPKGELCRLSNSAPRGPRLRIRSPTVGRLVEQERSRRSSHRLKSSLRRNCALMATMIVEALMSTAAAAGARTIPAQMKAPAASGMATTL